MKLYIAAGRYVGTQAEAKSLDKLFTAVEVPTDKEGLIGYLNSYITRPSEHVESIMLSPNDVTEDDAVDDLLAPDPAPVQPPSNYAISSVALDDAVAAAPLALRLTWASIALEDARAKVAP